MATPSTNERFTWSGSACDGCATATRALSHSLRATPCGASASLMSNQVYCGARASKRVRPVFAISLNAPTYW